MMSQEREFINVREQFQQIEEFIGQAGKAEVRIDKIERELFSRLLHLGLSLLKVFVAQAGDGDVGESCTRDGETTRRLPEPHARRYLSVFGELSVERRVYGTREGQAIEWVPLDARLGLPAGEISYVLEDWLQRLAVKESFHEAAASLESLLGLKVGVHTAERLNRELAGHAASFRAGQQAPPPQNANEILVVTADGKGVPMRGSDRPEPQSPPVEQSRSDKGPKRGKKRMSYVGAVYGIDPFVRTAEDVVDEVLRERRAKDRPVPQDKHVWAELTRVWDDGSPEGNTLNGRTYLFAELAVECLARDPQQQRTLVCLMDGEVALWEMQREWLGWSVGVLDLFHVMERLWGVAHCLHGEKGAAAKDYVTQQLRLLLQGKIGYVIGGFRRAIGVHGLKGNRLKTVNAAIGYFKRNREHMRYDEYLAAGYPIGSGVAEGACRHLVKDRMEQTGMHWTVAGAQAMLSTRAIYLNGEWSAFIEHRIQREQDTLYALAA